MSRRVDGGASPDDPCRRSSGLVLRFFAGEANLEEIDFLLLHLPSCAACRQSFDTVGRETGATGSSWQEALSAYDPEQLLEAAGEVRHREPAGALVAIRVMLGEAWEGARRMANGLLTPAPQLVPLFRSPEAAPSLSTGNAGEVKLTLARLPGGGLQVTATGLDGQPLGAKAVRLEALGRPLCEAAIDERGLATFSQLPDEPFDTIDILL